MRGQGTRHFLRGAQRWSELRRFHHRCLSVERLGLRGHGPSESELEQDHVTPNTPESEHSVRLQLLSTLPSSPHRTHLIFRQRFESVDLKGFTWLGEIELLSRIVVFPILRQDFVLDPEEHCGQIVFDHPECDDAGLSRSPFHPRVSGGIAREVVQVGLESFSAPVRTLRYPPWSRRFLQFQPVQN